MGVSLLTATSEDLAHLYYNINECLHVCSCTGLLGMEIMSTFSQTEDLGEILSSPAVEGAEGR